MIKVADFGLSESMYARDYFREHKQGGKTVKLPVKWMAIESFVDGIFTEKTDVVGYCVRACMHSVIYYDTFKGIGSLYKGIYLRLAAYARISS